MEVGCLSHPGASTIDSQLLDGVCSNGWQILETEPRAPTQKGRQAPVTLINCYSEKRVQREGQMLEDVLACKTMLTVNVITVKAANPSPFRRPWNPGACTYQDTADNYRNAGALCC